MADQAPAANPDPQNAVMNPPAGPDFQALNDFIRQARTVNAFLQIYESEPFGQCMRAMRVNLGNDDPCDWARAWAIRMRQELPADVFINRCRQTTLLLVYELMTRWKEGAITADDIVGNFKDRRLVNILGLALPLDRAQCLYRMQYPGRAAFGMHWVSEQHVAQYPAWQDALRQVDGRPTINKRYLWLVNDPAFAAMELNQNDELMRLLESESPVDEEEDDIMTED